MVLNFVAQTVFWSSVAALLYTYAGYPLLVYTISLLFPKTVKQGDFEPEVTILITAYNEERAIRAKLENTLDIDYVPEKLEILVASDCSNDKTEEIVKEFAARGVKLHRQTERLGKTMAQNAAVEIATGEIILFSDATTMYAPDVLRRMLPNFADETVGCVAGKLIYVDETRSQVGTGAKRYWSYETFLKESESRACSLIGASGCLYAVRKSAYRPMYAEACSDFLIATVMREQNLRTVYEPNAICTEETNQRTDKEIRMRVRVISQTITDLWRNRAMLSPFKSGFYAVELVSHKIFRYSVPLFLIALLVSTAALAFSSETFVALFALQIVFYAMAFAAWMLEKTKKSTGVLAMPLYFVLTNLASTVGFYKFLRGERFARWEPIRDNEKWKVENGKLEAEN
ncbi:MAG: glycosyltransferase family 2 protein [Acidobacteriota bacterium]|nr:glycosyltransferase family 2 protein [Acidobacteriota bacterium]